jgi:processive 1,2-diacylglycerol beta-glucosyltransferase
MGFGTGHNTAANVLTSHFQQLPDVKAETVDLLQLIPHTFHPLLQFCYTGMLNRFPFFYHYLYDWTQHYRVARYVSSEFLERTGWIIRKRLHHLSQAFAPTRIVTTHPFSLLLGPSEWEGFPTVGVVTDYELHPIWLARVPDLLCIPKQLLPQSQWERIGIPTGVKLCETGIPIHPRFYDQIMRDEARKRLGLDCLRPVVLIMGGGMGLGPLELLVEELQGLHSIQFVVLPGNNFQLYHRLKHKYGNHHIRVESFRKDIPLWMSAADLLVTKPGGVTISEAIAKQLPMFLFEAFPGQEEANQQYLLHHRVAFVTRPRTIRIQIEKFFSSSYSYKREQMRERFKSLLSLEAAEQIVHAAINHPHLAIAKE